MTSMSSCVKDASTENIKLRHAVRHFVQPLEVTSRRLEVISSHPFDGERGDAQHGGPAHSQHQLGVGQQEVDGRAQTPVAPLPLRLPVQRRHPEETTATIRHIRTASQPGTREHTLGPVEPVTALKSNQVPVTALKPHQVPLGPVGPGWV